MTAEEATTMAPRRIVGAHIHALQPKAKLPIIERGSKRAAMVPEEKQLGGLDALEQILATAMEAQMEMQRAAETCGRSYREEKEPNDEQTMATVARQSLASPFQSPPTSLLRGPISRIRRAQRTRRW